MGKYKIINTSTLNLLLQYLINASTYDLLLQYPFKPIALPNSRYHLPVMPSVLYLPIQAVLLPVPSNRVAVRKFYYPESFSHVHIEVTSVRNPEPP